MTSRLVTVDLILTVSLRLRQWKPLPITEEGSLGFYTSVREILNGWAKQIEAQGLSVSLETIASGALHVFDVTGGERLWDRLTQIGDSLIERAREIEEMILDRTVELLRIPMQEEIAKALKEGDPVPFKKAKADITALQNPTEAKERLKEFLAWLRDWCVKDPESEASRLLGDIIEEERELTTSAVKLFKSRNYFPLFNALHGGVTRGNA